MQRQSLGSPTRERLVLSPNDTVLTPDDLKRRDSSPPPFSTSTSIAGDDDEIKPEKPHRSYSSPEKFIHFIPLFIFLCFLILYLFSHDPSPQDLAQFHGFNFKHAEEIIETNDMDTIGRIEKNDKQLKRSRAFVVRSLRNLEEEEEEDDEIIERDEAKVWSNRKLGDF